MKKINYAKLMLEGYLECALWVTFDGDVENTSIINVTKESIKQAEKDINTFLDKTFDKVKDISPSQVGHDLFLTRNRHGAGFWDRGLGKLGEELTKLSVEMKEVEIYQERKKVHIN